MTERERLIELLNKQSCPSPLLCDKNCKYAHLQSCYAERVADYLLANNVVALPCKVGDTVYILAGFNGRKYEKDICEGFYVGYDGVVQVRVRNIKGNHGTYGVMGETVFLTKEEAEKALEG